MRRTFILAMALAVLAGCGGSTQPTLQAPPHATRGGLPACSTFKADRPLDGGMRFTDAGLTITLHPGDFCRTSEGVRMGVDK